MRLGARARLVAVVVLAVGLALAGRPFAQEPNGLLVFGSDFGLTDGAVSAMKGVALGIDRRLVIHDLTHEIPPFDIWAGAWHLSVAAPYWPAGTVFVMVVDPDVGTERSAVVMRTRSGLYVVAPDNGLLGLLAEKAGAAEVRRIDIGRHRLKGSETSHTFHGRDVFAVVGAKLAAGRLTMAEVGPARIPQVASFDYARARLEGDTVVGIVAIHDGQFGNVLTNIERATFAKLGIARGAEVMVRIEHDNEVAFEGPLPYVDTFGDVAEGDPLLYVNSAGTMALAINLGSFAGEHGIGYGPDWQIELKRP